MVVRTSTPVQMAGLGKRFQVREDKCGFQAPRFELRAQRDLERSGLPVRTVPCGCAGSAIDRSRSASMVVILFLTGAFDVAPITHGSAAEHR